MRPQWDLLHHLSNILDINCAVVTFCPSVVELKTLRASIKLSNGSGAILMNTVAGADILLLRFGARRIILYFAQSREGVEPYVAARRGTLVRRSQHHFAGSALSAGKRDIFPDSSDLNGDCGTSFGLFLPNCLV